MKQGIASYLKHGGGRALWLVGLLLCAPQALAGAWTQPRGQGYYKLEGRFLRAGQLYGPGGEKFDIPTLGDYVLSLYGEYGTTRRVTLVVYLPILERITLNEVVSRQTGSTLAGGDVESGFADPEVGLRVGLVQGGPTVVSAGVSLGIPAGNDQQGSGLLTGDGEFNQLLSLQAGHSFSRLPLYVSGEVGLNSRTGGFSDEFRYAAEVGYTLGRRLTLIGRVRGVDSLENGDDAVTGGTSGLFANNQEYLIYGSEIAFMFSDSFGISAKGEEIIRGRNIVAAPAYSIGLFLKH